MKDIPINKWERIDDLQLKGLKIIQDTRSFCFGMDAVLLSDFANVKKNDKVVDLGAGTGIVPVLLAGKTKAAFIWGLEIQNEMAWMAKRSIMLNNLENRVEIINGDLKNGVKIFGKNRFDVVTCNPPYMNSGGGKINTNDAKAVSRHEIKCTLEDVISVSSQLLKQFGRFEMVNRPQRLVDIIYLMRKYKIEPKRLKFVYPYVGKKANLILIEGIRCGNPELKMQTPLYVYKNNGEFSDEINKIYGREM